MVSATKQKKENWSFIIETRWLLWLEMNSYLSYQSNKSEKVCKDVEVKQE